MTGAAPSPRANTPKPTIQVSAPSAHSASTAQQQQQKREQQKREQQEREQEQQREREQQPEQQHETQTQTQTPPPSKLSPPENRRPGRNRSAPDYLSDKATAAFIRRVLCPQQTGDKARSAPAPIDELLPPLTSRNDVDLQLYAFIAVILREFVQAWYNKITPDETFVAEVVQIIAHCTRTLEQRLRKVDLESLLFDEIPDLLDRHISARRASRHAIARPPTEVDPREVYHSLCPLPYLSPVPKPDAPETVTLQLENETAYRRILVQGVLAILLPTEDLENPCLTSLVGQILSETIIGNVIANKAAQPWLLYEGLSILARNVSEARKGEQGRRGDPGKSSHRRSRSELNSSSPSTPQPVAPLSSFAHRLLISALHWMFLAYALVRLLVTTLASASSFPRRTGRSSGSGSGGDIGEKGYMTSGAGAGDTSLGGSSLVEDGPLKVPVVDFRVWACIANLIDLRSRMPWLSGGISMVQLGLLEGPGRIASLDGALDRFLSHHIQSLFTPTHLPPLLRSLRAALFPNNAPGTPSLRPPSNDAELVALRHRTAALLAGLVPPRLYALYFSGRPPWKGVRGGEAVDSSPLDDSLDLFFGDEYCNKHLMYGVLELVLVRLMPELSEKQVGELMAERLGVMDPASMDRYPLAP
ncbi:related to MSS51 protein [Cephalotrichum gorgonifer]|uniref:Related to MSS51 protein n=1 Tax=Cephalotrichum gorgonifer TaxID=2041049 RepID=A0AAE8MW09_9PEZI|nr:related to MSS51 protein [Cephalotrichum gorgonifer]